MAGITIPLFTMRTFSFTRSDVVVIERALDVRAWPAGSLMLRLHTSGLGSGSSMKLSARATAPSMEDPAQDFVYTVADIASVTVDSGDTAPALERAALTADFGGYLQLKLTATKGAGGCTALLSAELALKD